MEVGDKVRFSDFAGYQTWAEANMPSSAVFPNIRKLIGEVVEIRDGDILAVSFRTSPGTSIWVGTLPAQFVSKAES